MSTQISLEKFRQIYDDTYNETLKYIICNTSNIDDVNELLQSTYVELYIMLEKKKSILLDNVQSYIIGIAKNKIKRHYSIIKRFWNVHKVVDVESDSVEQEIPDNFSIEDVVVTKEIAQKVWDYIKKKDILTTKIFYLYYYNELKLSQIAAELNITEQNVKNKLYRTLNELRKNFLKEGD